MKKVHYASEVADLERARDENAERRKLELKI